MLFIMKKQYNTEIEWMIDFYTELGLENKVDYECNTDGRLKGCLNEFKLNFTDLLWHKKQVERYLKAYNSVAKEIPKKTLLIDINNNKYIEWNVKTTKEGVSVSWSNEQIHWETPVELEKYFNLENYCKGWIDEQSIISYNNLFCENNNKKTTSKDEVKKELINPQLLNIFSFNWSGQIDKEKNVRKDNNWLTFNMNMLGSDRLKKQLGAFFTPDKYIKISTRYLRNAIKNIPENMDYVIVDRCAWTGNLEKFLTEEELNHCILNTIDYTEWTTLKGLYEWRVKYIIPHTSESRNDENGLMKDWDALQKDFYDKLLPLLEGKYIIMLENPPFADVGWKSWGHNKDKEKAYINKKMLEKVGWNLCNELWHQFIWSAWEYIKPNEYILFSPIKYWKLYELTNKEFIEGSLCNSEFFNAPNPFSISLIHWNNVKNDSDEIIVNIEDTNDNIKIKKCKKKFSYDKTKYNSIPIARYRAESFMLGSVNEHLSNDDNWTTIWERSKPFYKENILEILPLFCAKQKYHYYDDWTEKLIIFNSLDWNWKYLKDIQFKNNCFLYSCLTEKNKCISKLNLKNELCLLQNTIADTFLTEDMKEHNLIKLWKDILNEIKKDNKVEYNEDYKYWLYQIQKEINIKIESWSFTKSWDPIMKLKYPTLDEKLKRLKEWLKIFYKKNIEPKLFEYELLK